MTSGHDRTIRLWNPHRDGPAEQDSGLCVKVYKGSHAHEINGLCISHDNNRFASCGADKLVFLWDVATGQVNTPELSAHAAPARRTHAFAPTNANRPCHLTPSTAPTSPPARPPARPRPPAPPARPADHPEVQRAPAARERRGLQRELQRARLRLLRPLRGAVGLQGAHLQAHPGERRHRLACLGKGVSHLPRPWPVQELKDFKDSVTSVVCTGDALVAGCVDGVLRSYDLRKGLLVQDALHEPVTGVRVSADGNCLLASCLDSTVRLIERESGNLLNE